MKGKNQYGSWQVYTRHTADCSKGFTAITDNECSCTKSFVLHPKGQPRKRIAAGTSSYTEACEEIVKKIAGWNPEIAKARKDAAKAERKALPIAVAVSQFIDQKVSHKRKPSYVRLLTGILGKLVTFFEEEYNVDKNEEERVTTIGQIDADVMDLFQTWLFKQLDSDTTRQTRWIMIRSFFSWLRDKGRIEVSPVQAMKAPKVKKGNRCGAWTEVQEIAIFESIEPYCFLNLSWTKESDRPMVALRLRILVLLMRFSGMAIIDAMLFRPALDNSGLGLNFKTGVLRYRRQKSGELAVVPIESQELLDLIRAGIPLEPWSDPNRPFAPKGLDLNDEEAAKAAIKRWTVRLNGVYELAGIEEIITEIGVRDPHAHMFRDTFAKWHLDRGTDIRDLAKMLGHSKVSTTETNYASWMHSDQEAMIARIRARQAMYETGNVVTMKRRAAAAAD